MPFFLPWGIGNTTSSIDLCVSYSLSAFRQQHKKSFSLWQKLLNLLFLILRRVCVWRISYLQLQRNLLSHCFRRFGHTKLFSDSKVGKLSIFHSAVVILLLWWFHLLFIYISLSHRNEKKSIKVKLKTNSFMFWGPFETRRQCENWYFRFWRNKNCRL